jgi:parvulin-like peptidyl-prolyl isomerase
MLTLKRPISLALPLAACLCLVACGSSTQKPHSTSSASTTAPATQVATSSQLAPPSSIPPHTVLARVDGKAIDFATVAHLIAIDSAPSPAPDPPSFTSCIAAQKAKSDAAAQQPEAELEQSCQKSYQAALATALGGAIHNQWLLGEAGELGLHVSAAEVQHEFELSKKSFKSEAEFTAYRKSTGESLADMRLNLKLGKLTDKIFEKIKQKEHPATNAEVGAYYAAQRSQYTIPAGRDVRILRTTTAASAARAKEQIQSGKSFAAVVKELSTIGQPITAAHGEIADLSPTLFGEKVLNDAIFSAKLNQLSGPVRVVASHRDIAPESGSGYFIFEVKSIVPAKQTPLGAVRNGIAEELTKAQKERTISSFIIAFRRKWTERTDCQPGYVVPRCRQYKGSTAWMREDPFTL